MDAPLAVAALVVVALGFELRHLVELARLARDRDRETPVVIRSMPLSFKAPPAPYQSSTGGDAP
jgi:hypothetical protein